MSDELLRQIAADLNQSPDTASRTARMSALVTDVNARIATDALKMLPFDSTPYAYQAWLADTDDR
ncbi:hypothetical protein RPMA_07390 [Tardiphaga alba]|uniref:Uncharacterized protein n=1 Tax=Tardiphaga alba TaxID=340268 RepID=A0ABX8A5W8_9BRAD|nr:hypothetical protein [Tardiphaga alba]QUS38676.1 hypothetical protein RPMA_07390 [Tardiphaga alba]